MDIQRLKENWNEWGKKDPLWGVLTWSDKKNNQWEPSEFFKTGDLEIKSVFEYLKSKNIQVKNGHALDFGCGVGRLTQALAKEFTHVTGVDIAPSMIEHANRYNSWGDRCRYIVNDSDNLELFSDNSFDFVYTNIVLQHMEPKYSMKYLQEFIRILSVGGVAVFQLPSERRLKKNKKPSIGSRIKRKLKSLIIRYTVRKVKDEPVMEMYGVKREDVVDMVNQYRVKIIDIADDNSTSKWISYRYCIQKI